MNYIGTVSAIRHPYREEYFSWRVLITKLHSPFIASIYAMERYRYRTKEKAKAAAKRTVEKLMPGIKFAD